MNMQDDVMLLMARERIAEAEREAEIRRAVRMDRISRPAHVRLGLALVRLGHWLMADHSPLHSS